MINGKRIAVVMPAFNAERTLEQTVRGLPDVVDIRILVDDSSNDRTAALSKELGVRTFIHDANYGYGRNQQTCYREALAAGADIVVMVHPDYQYTPAAGCGHCRHGRQRSLRYGSCLAHSRRGRAQGRNAALQIHRQPAADRISRTCFSASSCRSITPASGPFRGNCWRRCPCSKTPTILSSTTR